MNNYDLIISMQNLREKILASNVVNSKLQMELRVNNLIRLTELGLITKENLSDELSKIEIYSGFSNKRKTK